MAIGNFGQLKTAISTWLHRSDLSSVAGDFVALAESAIRQDVRCRAMEQTATGTLTTTNLALPTRFAEARRVLLNNNPCKYVTPEDFQPRREQRTNLYTIECQNFRFQSGGGDYQIDYYQWFAPFADDGDTNWLLTNHPDIYLFAALAEAEDYLKGDRTRWVPRYAQALQRLKAAEARFTGPMTIRPEVVE